MKGNYIPVYPRFSAAGGRETRPIAATGLPPPAFPDCPDSLFALDIGEQAGWKCRNPSFFCRGSRPLWANHFHEAEGGTWHGTRRESPFAGAVPDRASRHVSRRRERRSVVRQAALAGWRGVPGVQVRERPTRGPQPFRCRDCRKGFYARTGSVMQGSPLPFRWHPVMRLRGKRLKYGVRSGPTHPFSV